MADPRDAVPAANGTNPSVWDAEPELVCLEIASWEHAVLVPGSYGRADRVADLKRRLPDKLTGPIYALLERAEALFLRRTEPIPPFRERLARDFSVLDKLRLEGELDEIAQSERKFADILPEWDEAVAAALGDDVENVTRRIRDFPPFGDLGLPRGTFSLGSGYRLSVRRIRGGCLGPALATHRTLLMGCFGPFVQPGRLRELQDLSHR